MTATENAVATPAQQEVDALVTKAQGALKEFLALDQEAVDYIVKKASVAALSVHGELAVSAVKETGRGVFEDKAVKNIFACEHVTNSMLSLRTAGVISHDELTGITEIAEPVGVICGVTPVTNPTSTAIFKALISLKTRNPIVFGFHPPHKTAPLKPLRLSATQLSPRGHLKTASNGLNTHHWKQPVPS